MLSIYGTYSTTLIISYCSSFIFTRMFHMPSDVTLLLSTNIINILIDLSSLMNNSSFQSCDKTFATYVKIPHIGIILFQLCISHNHNFIRVILFCMCKLCLFFITCIRVLVKVIMYFIMTKFLKIIALNLIHINFHFDLLVNRSTNYGSDS